VLNCTSLFHFKEGSWLHKHRNEIGFQIIPCLVHVEVCGTFLYIITNLYKHIVNELLLN
jgi:hypothetical protein